MKSRNDHVRELSKSKAVCTPYFLIGYFLLGTRLCTFPRLKPTRHPTSCITHNACSLLVYQMLEHSYATRSKRPAYCARDIDGVRSCVAKRCNPAQYEFKVSKGHRGSILRNHMAREVHSRVGEASFSVERALVIPTSPTRDVGIWTINRRQDQFLCRSSLESLFAIPS